jgi:hypothetical protein
MHPIILAPWHDSMSDGCSGAPLLSALPKACRCCVRHDRAYYYGGSEEDRLTADKAFLACLLAAGAPWWRARGAYQMVRWFGGPDRRVHGVSWAFGGHIFAYTEKPAEATI